MRSAFFIILLSLLACDQSTIKHDAPSRFIVVLGVAQDAGYPQAGCEAEHCQEYWNGNEEARYAVSLGIIDNSSNMQWMMEATPDFKEQLKILNDYSHSESVQPDGIFLTHAHMGHYTGLMHLGREAMGADQVPVYAMPRMKNYLETNGPWSQLVNLKNIVIRELKADSTIQLTERISITALQVPHRDEFSETVGYIIEAEKKILFIPDIDKWENWERDIRQVVQSVDVALLDATFYEDGEIPNRDMSEIPHPFVEESMEIFDELPEAERNKIHFIHFNHSNPLIFDGAEFRKVKSKGYQVARRLDIIPF